MNDATLIQRIRETAVLHGDFTLRSGRKSRYYLDKYQLETQPDVLRALGERFAAHVDAKVDRLAGAELGGIPLVTVTALATGKPIVFIRNQKKEYGTAKQLEGSLNVGDLVVLLEDVATTGGQILEAAKVIENAGAKVHKIVAAIDRQEGARENITEAGYTFESLLTKKDLGLDD